jgi:hypothetical protein
MLYPACARPAQAAASEPLLSYPRRSLGSTREPLTAPSVLRSKSAAANVTGCHRASGRQAWANEHGCGREAVTEEPAFEVDDAIVLLLGARTPGQEVSGHLSGITRLEKLIFLLERETDAKAWLTEPADFIPYNFGPFSSKVYQAIDTLVAGGLLKDSGSPSDGAADSWERFHAIEDIQDAPVEDPYATRDFSLTDRGQRYFEVLSQQLPKGAMAELSDFKSRFSRLPLRQLVRYVYQRYDAFTSNSLIRDDILGKPATS